MSDKVIFQSQLEHLQSKYVGAGNPDISKHDWVTNQHRDTIGSYIGHSHFLTYFSIVNNQSIGRTKFDLLMNMYRPCGVDPAVQTQLNTSNGIHNNNTEMKDAQ